MKNEKSFNGGGNGSDSCSPWACVDVLVVGGEANIVMPSACLCMLWLLSSAGALVLSKWLSDVWSCRQLQLHGLDIG